MAASVVPLMSQSGKIAAKDPKAAEAMTEAIKALGGEKNIDNIKSLILTGTMTWASQKGRVDKIEIKILLPNNILRTSEVTISGLRVYQGITKGELINTTFSGTNRVNTSSFGYDYELAEFARLLTGALLRGGPVDPLTITSITGISDKFSVAATTEILGEIEFDPKEKYPLLISYKGLMTIDFDSSSWQMTTDPKTGMSRGSLQLGRNVVVDTVMRFKDRSAVDGVMFPRTIVYERQGEVFRELKIDKIQINPKLTLADFEIPR